MFNFRINHCTGTLEISGKKSNIVSLHLCFLAICSLYSALLYYSIQLKTACEREDLSLLAMRNMEFQPRMQDGLPRGSSRYNTRAGSLPGAHTPSSPAGQGTTQGLGEGVTRGKTLGLQTGAITLRSSYLSRLQV